MSLAVTRKLHMAFLVSLLVGYTMRDIRYKWNEGPNSVGVSNEVSLPQFKVLGHRQRAMEISLTTGISFKCHPHTLTTDISSEFLTPCFKTIYPTNLATINLKQRYPMYATLIPLQYAQPMNANLIHLQQIYPMYATLIPLQYTHPMNATLIPLKLIQEC